eukprot:TRINITY_DN1270_c0_g1_i1.p1 TRINITY_DN1270_c0_g1~~TRINITY_DN1270_c0_g1_i1.p1  ORF type:complete len:243 (+),score=52.16 TRINITY_DN1270_c0_g1_i1:242-970(+)
MADGASPATSSAKRWIPLEANPDVMNQIVWGLGLDEKEAEFNDVYGFDDELLEMVPKPVLAVLFLYPITQATEQKRIVDEKQFIGDVQEVGNNSVYFMQQTVRNACGTVGILHAIGNSQSQLNIRNGSFFQRFFTATASMTPEERAKFLENESELEAVHSVAANAGDTAPPDPSTRVDLHFVCLTCVDGKLYELDGRRSYPLCHGPSSAESVLKDAVRVIKNAVEQNPDSVNFNVIALSKKC